MTSRSIVQTSPVWSCLFCQESYELVFYEEEWFSYGHQVIQQAILNDVLNHIYIEVKEYMMSKDQFPNNEKAYYVLSEAGDQMLKYIDNYLEFKDFCYKRRLAKILYEQDASY